MDQNPDLPKLPTVPSSQAGGAPAGTVWCDANYTLYRVVADPEEA